jgi:hypothetical protein
MTSYSAAPSVPPRNALLAAAPQAARPASRAHLPGLLASAIGHAAVLSDTPAKWESTIAMLKQNGVDPKGYEDFEKGRPAAIAAARAQAPAEDDE